jgi:hypothetical protein
MPELFKIRVQFVDSAGAPLRGEGYRVTFHDKDVVGAAKLGESGLDANGTAEAVCSIADVKGLLSPGETKPDVFCVLTRDGQEIHRSRVVRDFDPAQTTGTSGVPNATLDLGTITVG